MTGQEIAEELGITRQAVSKILQKAVTKVYNKLTGDPNERLLTMIRMFDINDEKDIKSLYKLLPKDAKEFVKLDLQKRYYIQ